jgi:RNA polymerase sigma-70 factor (ECF subfamily)
MPATQQTTNAPAAPAAPTRQVDEFHELYLDARDDLYSYLSFLVGDLSLAEELTATAFERALRKRRLFDRTRGDLRGWLFSIARNAAVDELRRGSRESALEFADVVSPGDLAGSTEDRVVVVQAIRQLQAREREVIALKFFGGLSNAQIARVVGVSESNAGTQLHRAMKTLRERIGGDEDVR